MQNIYSKIAIIVVVILLAVWSIYPPDERIRLGSDLKGGISLVYQVDIDENVDNPTAALVQVIEVLMDRVNPSGLLDITMVPQGRNRIEIVMPLPSEEVLALKTAYEDALESLTQDAQINPFDLGVALGEGTAPQRWREAGDLTAQIEALQSLYNEHVTLMAEHELLGDEPTGNADRILELERQIVPLEIRIDALTEDILRLSLNEADVRRMLRLSTDPVAETDSQGDVVRDADGQVKLLDSPREMAIKGLERRVPHMRDRIADVVIKYDAYAARRTGFDDPEDLKRLLRGAGVLEYFMAVQDGTPENLDFEDLRRQLVESGPTNLDPPHVAWFPINDLKQWYDKPSDLRRLEADPILYFRNQQGLVAARALGEYFLLLHTADDRSITHKLGEPPWGIVAASTTEDRLGRPAVSFTLDTRGGTLMRRLTSKNINKPMAIVLDGQVYSAPSIITAIGERGQITGNFSQAEVRYLIRVLSAGSLQARLNPEPIAEITIGPTIGSDNLSRGLNACIYGLIAVAVFMLIYYFFAGAVANFALIMNGLIIFGVMALQQAMFTLPGIAGIVLTMGMAVDANVLIYERIREEIFAGESDLKTAVRVGYQKAFSTIIDANVTNLIICVVLYYTATTAVKGFALTLGIGIVATLFTALFVTRTIYTVFIDGLGAKRLPMLATVFPAVHRALEPNINWLGMRRFLHPLSIVAVIGGLTLAFSRGADLLDTEFRGGMSLTFRTVVIDSPGPGDRLLLARPDVEARTRAIGENAPDGSVLKGFESASVVTVGSEQEGMSDSFQVKVAMATTTGDDEMSDETTIRNEVVDALIAAFEGQLDVAPQLSFLDSDEPYRQEACFPITKPVLSDVIGRTGHPQRVGKFLDGVAVVVDVIEPQVTVEDVRSRIKRMRQQPDFGDAAARAFEVIGLEGDQPGLYHSVVILVRDENLRYQDSAERWETGLAESEWQLVSMALGQKSSLEQVNNFSSAIAQTLAAGAIVSVFLSLFGILLYIWVRFGSLRYSLAAIVALLHDVSIALGLLALTHILVDVAPFVTALGIQEFRIDLGVVAALLTIIGYSLNDTIVILDRIRENRGKLPIASARTVNLSINQTISRTVLTSFTTLLAVLIMYAEGGTGIRPFAFCLLIGVVVGTYSSVAIAAPLVFKKEDDSDWQREGSEEVKDTVPEVS